MSSCSQITQDEDDAPKRSGLTIRLLGRFEVLRNGSPIPGKIWGRRRTEAVLKVLLSKAGRVVSQDQLIDALFPHSDPEDARKNLFARISELRRILEPYLKRGVDSTYIVRKGQGYYFSLRSPCWIDTVEVGRWLTQGDQHLREGKSAEASTAYEQAIALYRGDFLEDDPYEEWTFSVRGEWQEKYVSALTNLAQAYENAGDRHRAMMACRMAFEMEPYREPILQQLMSLYRAAGDRPGALRTYERGVEALRADLGIGPSDETIALRDSVLEDPVPDSMDARNRSRIAVLPLVNLSSEPEDEYFVDGLTEELIYALSKIQGLKVIAQTSSLSYRNTKKTVAQIGRELSIGSLIEGSVRRAGNAMRVTVQLIDAISEIHLWAREYDRELEDILSVQSEIAKDVARELMMALVKDERRRLPELPIANSEAHALYRRGRLALTVMDGLPIDLTQEVRVELPRLREAIECFEEAVEIDPGYARAWSGLADALCLFWFFSDAPDEVIRRAEEAASLAVEHDPRLGEAYASEALIRWIGRKDVEGAEVLLAQATMLSPENPSIHRWHARILRQQSRRGEALIEMLRTLELDPLSLTANIELADFYLDTRRFDDAVRQARSILELHPTDTTARLRLAKFLMLSWDWEAAETEYIQAIALDPENAAPLLQYSELLLSLGRTAEGEATLHQALQLAGTPCPVRALECAGVLYFLLDDVPAALRCFTQAMSALPRIRMGYFWSAICHWALGNYDEALEWVERYRQVSTGFYRLSAADVALSIEWVSGMIYAAQGDRLMAEAAIERAKRFREGMPRRALGIAAVFFHLGNMDEGFEWLKRAVDDHCFNLQRIAGYRLPQCVREDPRYAKILEPTGLVRYAV